MARTMTPRQHAAQLVLDARGAHRAAVRSWALRMDDARHGGRRLVCLTCWSWSALAAPTGCPCRCHPRLPAWPDPDRD